MGIVVIVASIMLLAAAVKRLARKLKAVDLVLAEQRAEIDQLRQAEDRRALADLKSNRAFLENLAFKLADATPSMAANASSTDRSVERLDPARLKRSSTG
jgi:hypothetical protein